MTFESGQAEEHVPETADDIILSEDRPPEDPVHPERSSLPPVQPPSKLPVPGVPSKGETGPVDAEHTRFRGRSKYRAWA